MRHLCLLCLAALALCACERPADTTSVNQYGGKAHGISFSYPGNWSLDKESEGYIAVESSGDALLMVLHFDRETNPFTLESLAADLDESRAAEGAKIAGGMVAMGEATTKEIPATMKSSKRSALEQRFTVGVLGEQVPHVSHYHRFDGADRVCFLVAQVATEDWEMAQPGFQLVYDTFRVGAAAAADAR